MRYQISYLLLVGLITLQTSLHARASDKLPLAYNPGLFREEVIKIDPKTVDNWIHATRGTPISLPWFNQSHLPATVEKVKNQGKFTTVIGNVEAKMFGSVVLTIGDDVLVGAVTIDTEHYRLRSSGGGLYSLVEINLSRLPEFPDTIETTLDSSDPKPPIQTKQDDELFQRLGDGELLQLVEAEFDKGSDLVRVENGAWIDILIAYTSDAADWAQRNGLDIDAEISTMIDNANKSFAYSGIQTQLNVVGTTQVNHPVIDPLLEADLANLQRGIDELEPLHALRDQLKADLVSLLVLNGEQGCAVEDGTICGVAIRQNRFMGPGDYQDSVSFDYNNLWELNFASKGFSVVSIYNAFNDYTFTHEIGHNLGAAHDKYTFWTLDYPPPEVVLFPADDFAYGWVMFDIRARTMMAYNAVCENIGFECDWIPLFSNPLQSYYGSRHGNPAPGEQPSLFGPANNVLAINRMAQTVDNYRQSFPSP